MRENKRKRLEAKGWKVGTTKEFLELTKEEETYIELRLKLAEGLKQRRVRRRLTQVDLAKAVQSSQSRVAKMEAGDPSVSLDLLVRSLIALGTSSKELGKIISLSRVRLACPLKTGPFRSSQSRVDSGWTGARNEAESIHGRAGRQGSEGD
jgi:transcriptional regulator with XRE-family HTH domain